MGPGSRHNGARIRAFIRLQFSLFFQDWILQKIAIPDTSGATQAVQKSVYYVEVTVFDGNHAPAPGTYTLPSHSCIPV